MAQINTRGFTLVETLLFIVISSGFLLIAQTMLSGRTEEVQFRDATRTLQAFIQQQYNDVFQGVIPNLGACRWEGGGMPGYNFSDPPSANDGSCLFLGRVIEFPDYNLLLAGDPGLSEVRTYDMVGRRLNNEELSSCTNHILWCSEIVRQPGSEETFTIPWGSFMAGGVFDLGGPHPTHTIGIFRDPTSSRLIPVAYADVVNLPGPPQPQPWLEQQNMMYDVGNFPSPLNRDSRVDDEFAAEICLSSISGRRTALFTFGEFSRQESFDVDADVPCTDRAVPLP